MRWTGGIAPFALMKRSVQAYRRDKMNVHAAALAFRLLLALFPFIIFLVAFVATLRLPAFFDWLRQQVVVVLPVPALAQVDRVIAELRFPQTGLLSTGAAVALWIASQAVRALMDALNVAYRARESRRAWIRYPVSLFFTVCFAIMVLAAATLLVIGPQAMQWLAMRAGVEAVYIVLWTWLRLPVGLLLLILAVALVYHFLPNVRHRFRLVSAGSVLSVVVWFITSLAFGYYVQHFADYSVMYGSIGAVIVLLLYLYLSAAALLFGAEINAVIEQQEARQIVQSRSRDGAGERH